MNLTELGPGHWVPCALPDGLRIGSLCTGYGGLDMAVHEVLGGELAWVADNDPGAAAILAHRFPSVPNLGDIASADWSAAEPVDVLTAGFPCQDISCAGKRAGLRKGNRSGVWHHVAAAIAGLRPSLVVIENVKELLSERADSDVEPCPWCLGDAGPESAMRERSGVMDVRPLREITQTILYDPAAEARGVYGNCLQAAVASALGLDLLAVPHFGAFTWWEAAARLWLRGRSLDWAWVPAGAGLPEGRCIVVGQSPRETGRHAVAGDGGRITWDPHPSRAGLTEIQGAYEFIRWPGGTDGGSCVCCAGQIAVLAATGNRGVMP